MCIRCRIQSGVLGGSRLPVVVDFGLLHVLTHWAEGPTRPHHYASYLGSRTPSGGCPHVEFISVARLCVCQRQCFYRVLHRSMSPPGECVCVWLLCVYLSPMCKNITRITTSSNRSRVRILNDHIKINNQNLNSTKCCLLYTLDDADLLLRTLCR